MRAERGQTERLAKRRGPGIREAEEPGEWMAVKEETRTRTRVTRFLAEVRRRGGDEEEEREALRAIERFLQEGEEVAEFSGATEAPPGGGFGVEEGAAAWAAT